MPLIGRVRFALRSGTTIAEARIAVSRGVGDGRMVALGVGRGVIVALGRELGEGLGRGPMKAPPSSTSTAVTTTPMATPLTSERFTGTDRDGDPGDDRLGSWTSWRHLRAGRPAGSTPKTWHAP